MLTIRLPKDVADDLDAIVEASPGYSRAEVVNYLLKMATTHALMEIERDGTEKP